MMKKLFLSVLGLSVLAGCGEADPDFGATESPAPALNTALAKYDRTGTDQPILDWVNDRVQAGEPVEFANPLDDHAITFIKLSLAIGQYDANFVDAYSGPEIWRLDAENRKTPLNDLPDRVDALRAALEALSPQDEIEAIRLAQLKKMTRAMSTRLAVVRGETVSFDEEVRHIYDVTPSIYDLTVYDQVLRDIDALLPGQGSTAERVSEFLDSLAIPEAQLKPVFERAIAECRARTTAHFDLPEGETFTMEFVKDKSWSGYNYYQGNYESLIQINTDFPIIIDRAVDLGCHEGYPGHHVWNLFVEKEILGKRGWIEYSVQPLFGPFGPIAEGAGNFGIDLAFPGTEKIEFERDVLFPMAGLDPAKAETLAALNLLRGQLSHATNEISRQYLDGELNREDAIKLIQKYYLASAEKSEQRLKFIETYRAYVINYNVGQDLVGGYVQAAGNDENAQWAAFKHMLNAPMTASDLLGELNP